MAGTSSPVPLGDTGGWQREAGIWTATVRSGSPAGGQTQIRSTWTSPTFTAGPRQVYFAFDIGVAHQGAPGRVIRFVQQVRLCAHAGCTRWDSIAADDLPDQYTSAVPFQVTTGIGQALGTLDNTFRGYAQFRFTQEQRGLDEQTMTMRVAVGAAAARLESKQTG